MDQHFVTNSISIAFGHAIERHREIYVNWLRIAEHIGQRLQYSHLPMSIHNLGILDVVLRQIGSEFDLSEYECPQGALHLPSHLLFLFSDLWVCNAYEFFRLLKERRLTSGNSFKKIEQQLRLVRITLDKHEIAKNRGGNVDLKFMYHPPLTDEKTLYHYSSDDPHRSIIPEVKVNLETGAVQWRVVDVLSHKDETWVGWLDRQVISDEILKLWRSEFENTSKLPPRPTIHLVK